MKKCKHDIPMFQSCPKCKRDMVPADSEELKRFAKYIASKKINSAEG